MSESSLRLQRDDEDDGFVFDSSFEKEPCVQGGGKTGRGGEGGGATHTHTQTAPCKEASPAAQQEEADVRGLLLLSCLAFSRGGRESPRKTLFFSLSISSMRQRNTAARIVEVGVNEKVSLYQVV